MTHPLLSVVAWALFGLALLTAVAVAESRLVVVVEVEDVCEGCR